MKVGQTGITRHGLRATVIEVMGSFAVIKTDCGTRYTIHDFELWPDGTELVPGSPHMKAFHEWPTRNFCIKMVGEGTGRPKSMMVTGDDKDTTFKTLNLRWVGVRAVRG